MTAGPIGIVIGALLGIASYRALQSLKERVANKETKKVLHIVSMIDLISFPIIGYLVGAFLVA